MSTFLVVIIIAVGVGAAIIKIRKPKGCCGGCGNCSCTDCKEAEKK